MSAPSRLSISVLGPLSVRDGEGRDITPSGALQRRLLALLTVRRGDVVSVDTAIDVLWPSDPPLDTTAALQNHLFRLRRGLPDGVVESVGAGYRLDPSLVDVDVDRLERILAGELDAAARAELGDLLGRWNGRAVPELEDTDAAPAAGARFDELYAAAREALATARLDAGETDGLIAELRKLVEDHPLREHPRSLLMRALGAAGRTSEALRAYDDFRRRLADELGIEPSPSLAAQHAELLAGSAAAGRDALTSRLPAPATALVGRADLLDELVGLAASARVLTLVGPGGVGKTRLVAALGQRLYAECPQRPVVLCELAGAGSDTVADVVAAALDIDARPGVALLDRLVEVLGDAELVMLLDNCEHVLEPAAVLVERLLAGCPNVTIVATSRERLRVSGEHVRAVPTLLGADDSAAVALFVERARAVRPGFGVDGADGDRGNLVAEIVRRLDGLPLAIELAAARLHTLDLAEVAEGLDRPLALLAGGSRTSPRHSSLHAVVAWSYGHLDDHLRSVFDALSVFRRSFTVADAAAVCGLDLEPTGAALTELVERSLVLRAPARRYAMLDTLRAFGVERLAESGREPRVSERHARWMVEWSEEAARRLHRPGDIVLAEADAAVPELRAALDWLLAHRLVTHAGRLVSALINLAILRLRPDVLGWSERVIAADPDDRSPVASQVWAAAAYHAWMAGDMEGTARKSQHAAELAEREPDGLTQTVATMRGNVDLFVGRLDEATAWYERAVAAAGDDEGARLVAAGAQLLALGYAGDQRAAELAEQRLREFEGSVTAPVAYLWYCAGEAAAATDLELAKARFTCAIELAEATNCSFARGFAGASLASIEARTGDPDVAAAEYQWLIPHWIRAGLRSTQWTVLRSVVDLLERTGRCREAAVLEGAVRATTDGHQIFGADEVALGVVGDRLRATLGDAAYDAARREGAGLDGPRAAELALQALG